MTRIDREGKERLESLAVRFWGVRGSHPVPGQNTLTFGGNTPCVEIRAGGELIILDAGTGIVGLGKQLLQEGLLDEADGFELTMLISHTHHDHTQGFPFFKPLYRAGVRIHVFGPRYGREPLRDALRTALLSPYFPVNLESFDAEIGIKHLGGGETLVFDGRSRCPTIRRSAGGEEPPSPSDSGDNFPPPVIRVLRSRSHPRWGVLFFRIEFAGKSVVYATDTEGGNAKTERQLMEFSRGSDLLIHDAQYRPEEYEDAAEGTRGFGHSTYPMACRVAREAGVNRLLLFHYSPDHGDELLGRIEEKARRLFPATTAVREGTTFIL